jgi:adenosine deaminase
MDAGRMYCSFGSWNFSESLYFSLSTLLAAGLYAIPDDSDDSSFAIVALFAATGIPIAMMATGNVAKVGSERFSPLGFFVREFAFSHCIKQVCVEFY